MIRSLTHSVLFPIPRVQCRNGKLPSIRGCVLDYSTTLIRRLRALARAIVELVVGAEPIVIGVLGLEMVVETVIKVLVDVRIRRY